MTLLTILGIVTALAIVATIGLLWRDARRVERLRAINDDPSQQAGA